MKTLDKRRLADSMHMLTSIKVTQSLRFKMILAITVSLLVSSPIAAQLYSLLDNFIPGQFAAMSGTIINLFVTTTIIVIMLQWFVVKPLNKIILTISKASEGDLTRETGSPLP